MIIAVGSTRVYRFSNPTIVCTINDNDIHITVSEFPREREFIVRLKPSTMKRLLEANPDQTYQSIATTRIVNDLRNGFIQADEEIL